MSKIEGGSPLLDKRDNCNSNGNSKECVICSLAMKYGQERVLFNCGHCFHASCDRSLQVCPSCKTEIKKKKYSVAVTKPTATKRKLSLNVF